MDEELLKSKIIKHGITGLYYFSLINNFKNILEHGILSKSTIKNQNIGYCSFANEEVQGKRHKTLVELNYDRLNIPKISFFSVHELVPLYFTPRTPTFYSVKDNHENMFFVQIDPNIICNNNISFCFTDGNAALKNTKYFTSIEDLDNLIWPIIDADFWNDYVDGKRIRNSEMMIYPSVDFIWFNKIVVSNKNTLIILKSKISEINNPKFQNINFEINPYYFFL